MTAVEIIIIIMGLIFIVVSFMITEKLSQKDIEHIADLSSNEIDRIVKNKLQKAESDIQNQVEDKINDSVMDIERKMDKETNDKIMAISEYSDGVLGEINKNHSEVMFLYSMLNDKHEELTDYVSHISDVQKELSKAGDELDHRAQLLQEQAMAVENNSNQEKSDIQDLQEQADDAMENDTNHNEQIIALYKEGKDNIEIAKELGIGLGEVKLVIDLFMGGR